MITGEALVHFGGKPAPEMKAELKAELKAAAFDMDGFLSKHDIEVIRCRPWQSHLAV